MIVDKSIKANLEIQKKKINNKLVYFNVIRVAVLNINCSVYIVCVLRHSLNKQQKAIMTMKKNIL